ncbi:MAG: molybdenum cofactor guanylyltransferase [Elainella sp. Prado103]|jgi:molybdopterin-guanine dinucleotide biosynthesis protein A|nr:molybdenum cofactor guanylyltransferase [Elainella sp. Prado103]
MHLSLNHPSVHAIVLAGGLSSRMGQDKALLPFEGVPLLLRVCQVASRCTEQVCVVSAWSELYRSLFPDLEFPIQWISESLLEGEPQGPMMGFIQGLKIIQSDWSLLLACDLPRLQAEVLQDWIAHLPEAAPETVALLPRNPQGWWEPLCGFYRQQALSSLIDFSQRGGRSFQRWLDTQMVQELPLADPTMLVNCNTPADFDRLQHTF